MHQVIFVDLETSGLSSSYNQILEIGAVYVSGGMIDGVFHCYVNHPRITYDLQALLKFGDRIHDRNPAAPIYNSEFAKTSFKQFIRRCSPIEPAILGGKNLGIFDCRFLDEWIGQDVMKSYAKHRVVDIGMLFAHPLDKVAPNLSECLVRAKQFGILGHSFERGVTHTALNDAMQCAELYCGWWKGRVPHPKDWKP